MIYSGILSLVGNTPLVTINRLAPGGGVKILAKVESANPGGSIKDRVALSMIEAAERSGELTQGKVIIEATSGNTGIGLAMVCAVKGYKLRLLMPESASEERKRILRAYGADISLTPARLATDGAIEEAYRLAREEPEKYLLLDQYNNPASIEAHYRGTGQEIWDQTEGKVTHVVAALGTSGTAMGIVKRLKELDGRIKVVAVEPNPGHKIQGLKNMQESYPPGIYDKHALDMIVHVEDEEAFETCRRLAREEGLFVGMSSGAAMAAAVRLASELKEGMIVVICPDGGERYLSTSLFTADEEHGVELTDSTTGKRVFLSPGPAPLGIYTMGPSLDDLDDAEAWRRITHLDALGRHLAARGLPVRLAVGLADLDDRALAQARALGVSRERLAETALAHMQCRARELGVDQGVEFRVASASLETMFATTRRLLSRGLAYEKLRSVYFDVRRDKEYGRLLHQDPDKLSLGKTVDLADYVKENPRDFTLLKRASLQDLKRGDCLQTEWGNIRPSWLLQHACMAMDSLGSPAVVLAGQAHRFPHLENLRAIWSAGGAGAPKAWIYVQPVIGGQDGEQGRGNAVLPVSSMPAHALRLWLLSSSRRRPLILSRQSLAMWERNWRRVQELAIALRLHSDGREEVGAEVEQALGGLQRAFDASLGSGHGLSRFWPSFFRLSRHANRLLSKGMMTGGEARAILSLLEELDGVLRVLDKGALPVEPAGWPENVREGMARREEARRQKDFATADKLRGEIEAGGFRLEDWPSGPRLFRRAG